MSMVILLFSVLFVYFAFAYNVDKSDLKDAVVFNRGWLSPERIQYVGQKEISAFKWSVVFLVFGNLAIVSGWVTPEDIPWKESASLLSRQISLIVAFAALVLLPCVNIVFGLQRIGFPKRVAASLASLVLFITELSLYHRGWISQISGEINILYWAIFLLVSFIAIYILNNDKKNITPVINKRVDTDIKSPEALTTPYCSAEYNQYNVFISYKTDNVEFVRKIVDQLIASGYNAWFAEYAITSINDWHNENRFMKIISDGIRQSHWGIAFIDSEYSTSDYCIGEAQKLVEHCGKNRIIQIRLDDSIIPELEGVFSLRCTSNDLQKALDHISKQTGFSINKPASLDTEHPDYFKSGSREDNLFLINKSGWELVSVGDRGSGLDDGVEGPALRKSVLDTDGEEIMIFVNLFYGSDRESMNEIGNAHSGIKDDRELYEEIFYYADKHFISKVGQIAEIDTQLKGVHLLLGDNKRGNFAITYRSRGYWTRKVSILLPRTDDKLAYEFVFTFGFFGPFREYCRYTYLMDQLALSIEWMSNRSLASSSSARVSRGQRP